MTLVTWPTIGRLTCWLLTHSTAVQSVRNTSMLTSATWQTPVATILAELSIWQYGWWSKMGYHTGQHRGIYGEITGFLSFGLRFRTGSSRRGKKLSNESQLNSLMALWLISPAISQRMNCTMGHSVYYLSWTTIPTNDSSMRFLTTIRLKNTGFSIGSSIKVLDCPNFV